jgi:hypothetical protein
MDATHRFAGQVCIKHSAEEITKLQTKVARVSEGRVMPTLGGDLQFLGRHRQGSEEDRVSAREGRDAKFTSMQRSASSDSPSTPGILSLSLPHFSFFVSPTPLHLFSRLA